MGKNKTIQILRGIAISAVVLIHLFNLGLLNISEQQNGYWFFQLTHSLLQFAVPCFVLISSIMLSYVFKDKPLKLGVFYRQKFKRIMIPYIIWTFIYIVPQIILGQLAIGKLFKLSSWSYWLLYGKAYTHLYFMSIMVQFCIAAPIIFYSIKMICKFFKKYSLGIVLALAITTQIGVYWINRLYIYPYFKSTATLLVWYSYICLIGVWIGFYLEETCRFLKRYLGILLGGTGIVTILYLVYRVLILNGHAINTFYYQMIWYIYVLCVSLVLLVMAGEIKWEKLERVLEWYGEFSFGIYLMHPLLTYILTQVIKVSNPVGLLIIIYISFIAIMRICGYITKCIQSNRYISFICGDYTKGAGIHHPVIEVRESGGLQGVMES